MSAAVLGSQQSAVLRDMIALEDQPGVPEAIATVVAQARGKVCATCGLGQMGHAPESRWLGYGAHAWDPVPASREQVERARDLTALAYRARNSAT